MFSGAQFALEQAHIPCIIGLGKFHAEYVFPTFEPSVKGNASTSCQGAQGGEEEGGTRTESANNVRAPLNIWSVNSQRRAQKAWCTNKAPILFSHDCRRLLNIISQSFPTRGGAPLEAPTRGLAWRLSSSSSSSSSSASPLPTTQSPNTGVSWDSSGSHVVASGHVETPSLPKYALPPGYATLPRARYGGRHTVAMLLGDGISPEMMGHVKTVLHALAAPIDFDEIEINSSSDQSVLKDAILAIQRNGVALKGSLDTLPGMKSKNLAIRNQLGLFAYVQHCYTFPGVKTRHSNVDIMVIRENTEGEYSQVTFLSSPIFFSLLLISPPFLNSFTVAFANSYPFQLEHESVPGVVESLKIITRERSERIAKFAFDYATKHGRKKVTAVHKANIMKLGDGLFLNACAEVSKLYPNIEFNSIIIDNCCMQLVSRPQQFDVLVLPNLYGNIVGNLAVGLVGGAGIAAGMNLGDRYAIFEAGTRKSARSLRGQSVANPVAMLLASADMLEHLGNFRSRLPFSNCQV
ncbi:unnamed protein product [Dibothriocephalus latus]|uniref:Isopropylmalate dehydrogenase-like domain-containing protein n=1 Tax=Dibothriocephalus latus TaxID=60516 RepID=A0A3P7P246_DIBLA|nr:unnamed protein product [Dibothriocephalus latus]